MNPTVLREFGRLAALACGLWICASCAAPPVLHDPDDPLPADSVPRARKGGLLGMRLREIEFRERPAIRVESVVEYGPAARCGFGPGDVLIRFDGQPIRNADSFLKHFWTARRKPRLTLLRDGRDVDLVVGLTDLDVRFGVGDEAPDFRLPTQDGASHVQLSDLYFRKPVFLVFGSWT